jgi:A/G-specific adenine glycosylase
MAEERRPLEELAMPLMAWYDRHVRPLPWREAPTPYRVWVSEIMLQQTRIEAVLPYFERFMEALPDIHALATAPEDLLMKLWEGLGYYSRVRNLQKAARQVEERFGGQLPGTFEELLTLPGIGEYTAGAVASISFDQPVAAVDGNVLRVLARLTDCHEDVTQPKAKKRLSALADSLVPVERPGVFNSALMELGETVCLPNTQPRCEACPVEDFCHAAEKGCARDLPVRAPKKARRVEERLVLLVIASGGEPRVLLHRRPPKGLLAGMWELPNLLLDPGWDREQRRRAAENQLISWGIESGSPLYDLGPGKHIFTHVEWRLEGVCVTVNPFTPSTDYIWATGRQLAEELALPSAFRTYSALLPILLAGAQTGSQPPMKGETE